MWWQTYNVKGWRRDGVEVERLENLIEYYPQELQLNEKNHNFIHVMGNKCMKFAVGESCGGEERKMTGKSRKMRNLNENLKW